MRLGYIHCDFHVQGGVCKIRVLLEPTPRGQLSRTAASQHRTEQRQM